MKAFRNAATGLLVVGALVLSAIVAVAAVGGASATVRAWLRVAATSEARVAPLERAATVEVARPQVAVVVRSVAAEARASAAGFPAGVAVLPTFVAIASAALLGRVALDREPPAPIATARLSENRTRGPPDLS